MVSALIDVGFVLDHRHGLAVAQSNAREQLSSIANAAGVGFVEQVEGLRSNGAELVASFTVALPPDSGCDCQLH